MATAEMGARTEAEGSEAGPTGRPSFGWHESVAARPIGSGWGSEVAAIGREGHGAPELLVLACGGRSARLHSPADSGEFPRPYDLGSPVEGFEGLRCPCAIPSETPGRSDLVLIDDREGLVLVRDQGDAGRSRYGPREPLGLPADLGLGSVRVAQMAAVDWDGDGNVDLLVGLDDREGYWPDADDLPEAQQVGFNQDGGHPGYDRAGLWRGRAPRGRIVWLRNVGQAGRPRFEVRPEIDSDAGRLDLATRPSPLAVSWGGGQNLELLIADGRDLVRIHRNFGGQRPPVLMEPRTIRQGHAPLALPEDRTAVVAADIDGDGRAELIGGSADGRVFAIRATSRDAASMAVDLLQEPGPLWLGGHAVVAAGDLDGDGGLDLVFGDAPGHLWWLKDRGRGGEHRYAPALAIEAGGARFRLDPGPDGRLGGPAAPRLGHACPGLVDWTGNGRLDLLLGGAGGEVVLLRNDGSAGQPRFAGPVGLRCEGGPLILPPRVRPALADWRGSGSLDLLALDLQGFLCVYPKVDDKSVASPIPQVDALGRVIRLDGGFGLAGRCSLWAGPWAGSGRPDLLVGLPAASAPFVVPPATGEPGPLAASTVLLLENRGREGLVPRALRHADGRPLVVGVEGCSPSGIEGRGGDLDLLVGSDDGHIHYFGRDELRW